MSDDEADPELLALLRERFGLGAAQQGVSSDTGVLRDAEHIYNNAIDVSIDMWGTRGAAAKMYKAMRERNYSTQAWSEHELHPKLGQDVDEVGMINFVFTMDLLNFSFWSEVGSDERYQVEYLGRRWTGYNSLVACLRRALDEGIEITTPRSWRADGFGLTVEHVFRGATVEQIPLMRQRASVLREAADVLHEIYGEDEDGDVHGDFEEKRPSDGPRGSLDRNQNEARIVDNDHNNDSSHGTAHETADSKEAADALDTIIDPVSKLRLGHETAVSEDTATDEGRGSAQMVQADEAHVQSHPDPVVKPCRPDLSVIRLIEEADHSAGKLVNLLAQDFLCFRDEGRFEGRKVRFLKRAQIFVADLWAAFNGVGHGEFHDIAHLTMFAGVLLYSPPLDGCIRRLEQLEPGCAREQELRGCSIWAVELMRRQIVRDHPEAGADVHAVLLDFLMYDLAKEVEASGKLHTRERRRRPL